MNRKERRAEASRARQSDTMGTGYTLSELPESVKNSPGFKEGRRRAASGEGFSPEYFAGIDRATQLIRQWTAEHPDAELRWLEWDSGRTFIAAALDVGARYLADSPDAFALLEWLDAQFEPREKPSINMAGWALRRLRLMPMPDGSLWAQPPGPCGHCGAVLDRVSGPEGSKPSPGDLTACISCAGINEFGADMMLLPLSDEQVESRPEAAMLRKVQAVIREVQARGAGA